MSAALRQTRYADLCAEARLSIAPDEEVRAERQWVKGSAEEQIRLSWWKHGRMVPRPASLSEAQLVALLERGIAEGVFTPFFLRQLLGVMERNAHALVQD
ncbi:MAG: hypothetical protein HY689_04445 [Chloroflexi bacterium]|nr:hypothetical protein [Chloroflexota bacterium]